VVVVTASTSRSDPAGAPSGNSRRPDPSTSGWISSSPSTRTGRARIDRRHRPPAAPAQAQFQQTGQLPAPGADQVLAHGISTAFQLVVVFATLALAVALVVIHARAPEGVESA
jgi:hypothetical protein